MSIIIILLAATTVSSVAYLRHPLFGKKASGARKIRMEASPNFQNGKFYNLSHTPPLSEGHSMGKVMYQFLFTKQAAARPAASIPSVQTDSKQLRVQEDLLVWFGHSSYYFQLKGKRFLVDPVLSGNASPIKGSNKSFAGSDVYSPEDFPEIDYLLISHDHYDHLDYKTIKALQPKINNVVCGLGVGAHFEHWGFDSAQITELDWNETLDLNSELRLHSTPARHFSGRQFKRNNTLWLSFVLESNDYRMFIGGDGGYDTHFSEIGKRFGYFDLAILENGQYNDAWHEIHMHPHETWKAAGELNAKKLLPVHSGKFKLALHPWKEPLQALRRQQQEHPGPGLLTPKIGEPVRLRQSNQTFSAWWEEIA